MNVIGYIFMVMKLVMYINVIVSFINFVIDSILILLFDDYFIFVCFWRLVYYYLIVVCFYDNRIFFVYIFWILDIFNN